MSFIIIFTKLNLREKEFLQFILKIALFKNFKCILSAFFEKYLLKNAAKLPLKM